MTFLFRAVFWFAVVGAFMPREDAADARSNRFADTRESITKMDADAFCRSQREVCEAGEEIAGAARAAGHYAAERAVRVLADSR